MPYGLQPAPRFADVSHGARPAWLQRVIVPSAWFAVKTDVPARAIVRGYAPTGRSCVRTPSIPEKSIRATVPESGFTTKTSPDGAMAMGLERVGAPWAADASRIATTTSSVLTTRPPFRSPAPRAHAAHSPAPPPHA